MKTALKLIAGFLLTLIVILAVNTANFESRQIEAEPADVSAFDSAAIAERLSRGLKLQTISHSLDGPIEAEAFFALHAQLASDYPLTHKTLVRETVSDYSLLYTWEGTKPELPAALLLAHQDVVPVETGSEDAWEQPPYSGHIDATHVWGRGAMDDKGSLFCIMEAVEGLIARGYQPERTVLLAFGHDEELGGPQGATQIAQLLASRGIKAEYVLDEGGAVTKGTLSMLDAPVAVIGIAEKGSVSIDLVVETLGGHSSMPPRQTGIGILSAAIATLEANPIPGGIAGPVELMFDHIGPELDFPINMVMANLWLFRPLLERVFASDPSMDAMQRTTTAATIINGGVKTNVLPSRVKATVNFRILPGDTHDSVFEHVVGTIADDRIQVTKRRESRNPSPVSPVDSLGFKAIQKTVRDYFPTAIVTPYLVMGGTDSRYYSEISTNLYRFAPFLYNNEDRERIHGTNERIEIDTLGRAAGFYTRVIELTTAPGAANSV